MATESGKVIERDHRRRPAPEEEAHTLPFFEAAHAGHLVMPYCASCVRFAQPGVRNCPGCLAGDLDWREVSGRGYVFSYVVFHRSFHPAFEAPYGVCVIELAEGPRLVGNVIDIEPDRLCVGMPVTVTFATDEGDGPPVRFRPAGPEVDRHAGDSDKEEVGQ